MNVLSKHVTQPSIPDLHTYSKRPDFLKPKSYNPDFNNHQGDEFMSQRYNYKNPGKFLGAMPFEKRPRK